MSDQPNGYDEEQRITADYPNDEPQDFPDKAEQAEVLYTSDAIEAIIKEMNLDYAIREKSVSLAIAANAFENVDTVLQDAAKIEDFLRNGKSENNAPTE